MKKIISIIVLCMAMLVNCLTVSASNPKNISNDDKIELLQVLGIVDEDFGDLSDIMSREDFAILISKAFNIPVSKTNVRYFTDVEQEGYSVDTINSLVEQNIISKNDDNKFRPMEQIRYDEACKMLLNALGYGTLAEKNGGWPNGYLSISSQIELNETGMGVLLTKEDAFKLLYKALICDVNALVLGEDGTFEYKKDSGNTALLEYHNVDCFTGTVTAIYGMTIDSAKTVTRHQICIDDEVYETTLDANLEDYAGTYCNIWYKTDKNGNEKSVIYLSYSSKAKETVRFSIDDYYSFTSDGITYLRNSSKKTLSLETPYLIYNGSPLKTGYDAVMDNLNKGEISVIDSDGNGTYDIVSILDYKNFVVGSISDNKLYNKVLSGDYIDTEKAFDSVIITSAGGEELSFEDIAVGSTLSVAEDSDKNNIKIIVSISEVSGIIENVVDDEDETIATVNDVSYKFDKSYIKTISDRNFVSYKATLKLDHSGKISWMDYSVNSLMVGLTLSANYDTADEKIILKIYTENNEAISYSCSDKLRVDGVRVKTYKELINSMPNPIGASGIMMQVIRYRVNLDNEIDSIDTSNFNSNYESKETSLVATYDYPQVSWYNSGRIGIKTWIDNDTVTFFVPSGVEHPEVEDIYCGLYSYLIVNDFTLSVNAYRFGENNLSADALICEYETNDIAANYVNSAKAVMFDSVTKGIDDDGEVIQVLTGYSAGAKKTYNVPTTISFDGIEQGDLIRLYYGIDNKVSSNARTKIGFDYEVICKCKDIIKNESPGWENNTHYPNYYAEQGNSMYNYYKQGFQLSFGFVSRKDNNLIAWSYDKSTAIDEVANISGPVVIYNASATNSHDRIKIGSSADLLDYKTVGDGCSMILYHTRHGAQMETFIYQK